jgi:uncharacterized membrane protein YgaE (UPF0421/DUF939 family)
MASSDHDFWMTFILSNVIAIITVLICSIIIINMVKRINSTGQDLEEIKEIALKNRERSLANEERSLKNQEIIDNLKAKIKESQDLVDVLTKQN